MNPADIHQVLNSLRLLRKGAQQPKDPQFWSDFITLATILTGASKAHILTSYNQQTDHLVFEELSNTNSYNYQLELLDDSFYAYPWVLSFHQRVVKNAFAVHRPESVAQQQVFWLGIKLVTENDLDQKVLVLELASSLLPKLQDILVRGQLLADVPVTFDRPASDMATEQQNIIFNVLDVFVGVYENQKFDQAAYTLVNSLVSKLDGLDQVVLGWKHGEYVKVKAISHFESFEKKTDTVRFYEAALEEAVDQESGYIDGNSVNESFRIDVARQQLKAHLNCQDVSSFVIRSSKGEVTGALLCIRFEDAIPKAVPVALDFMLSTLSTKLIELFEKKGGVFLKAKRLINQAVRFIFGKEWPWTKFLSSVFILLILWMIYGSLPFRIEAKSQFVTDQTQLLSAPYDGFVEDVYKTSGDTTKSGTTLISLKTDDMLLQLAELTADLQRYKAEESKASANFNLVDAEIAKAKQQQVEVKISRIQLMLDQSEIKAPFEGVIVEGERKELLGSPIQKGDGLFRIAKIEGIYLTMQVEESDIHLVDIGDMGQFALVSQPLSKMPFVVENILPIANVNGAVGATFKVKAKLQVAPERWWRPGMTGVAKIDKGQAAPYWIFGRKLYHRLRIWFWW